MVGWLLLLAAVLVLAYFVYNFFAPVEVTNPVAGYKKKLEESQKKETAAFADEKKKIRKVVVDQTKMTYGPVYVYFASQTGTAEQFANDLAEEAKEKSIWMVPKNVKDFEVVVTVEPQGGGLQERACQCVCHGNTL